MLVDTDVIIWYIKKDRNAMDLLDRHKGFMVSCVTVMELIQNARNKEEVKKINKALAYWNCKTLYINEKISMLAQMNVEKYCLSHSHELGDALIAATAVVHSLTLWTGNGKHFSFLSELKLNRFKPVVKS